MTGGRGLVGGAGTSWRPDHRGPSGPGQGKILGGSDRGAMCSQTAAIMGRCGLIRARGPRLPLLPRVRDWEGQSSTSDGGTPSTARSLVPSRMTPSRSPAPSFLSLAIPAAPPPLPQHHPTLAAPPPHCPFPLLPKPPTLISRRGNGLCVHIRTVLFQVSLAGTGAGADVPTGSGAGKEAETKLSPQTQQRCAGKPHGPPAPGAAPSQPCGSLVTGTLRSRDS